MSPVRRQRDVLSAISRSIARRPMNARSSSARPRSIHDQPSSIGVDRSSSVQPNRLDEKSTSSRSSPASIRSMYSAASPNGRTPNPSNDDHSASQTLMADLLGTQISKPRSPL